MRHLLIQNLNSHTMTFFLLHVYGVSNVFWRLLALCGKKSGLDFFLMLTYMLKKFPLLFSQATFNTKIIISTRLLLCLHLYGASNAFCHFLTLCGKKIIWDIFSLLGYLLIWIPFLNSWASIDTKVEYQQH